ncbi:MAG: hypothetical protein ABJA74_03000 [Lapillicoccus sp.]
MSAPSPPVPAEAAPSGYACAEKDTENSGGPWALPPGNRANDGGPVTTATRDTHRFGYPSRQPPEVVALLVDDGSAGSVAAVAVQEAVERQAPIRFLQVLSSYHDDEGRALAEEAMFRAALHALHGHPRTQSVFEVVRKHPSAVVRIHSRDAALVVVGVSEQPRSPPRPSLADRCLSVARCPVRTVPIPA